MSCSSCQRVTIHGERGADPEPMFRMWLRSAFSSRPGRSSRRLSRTGGATV